MSNKKNCRYNNSHIINASQLLEHEEVCPDRLKRTDIKVCPYDKNHKINAKQYDKHLTLCKSKPKIDEKIRDQMNDYIQKKNNGIVNEPWDETALTPNVGWVTQEEQIKKVEAKKIEIIESLSKEVDYTEEDHIFFEAYVVS